MVDRLGKAMNGQVFVVENKPGAGGQIAAQLLKAAPADGSTIMLSIDHTQVIIPLTIVGAGYDPVADFTALAGVANYYNVLAVSPATGVRTMAEFGAWVKAHPTEANYGVPAPGSVPQFIGDVIGKSFGVTMNSVPYKGGAPMVQDLLAGQIPIGIASMTELIEYHRTGKVRILGSSGQERSKTAPEIPTFQELGFSGIDKNPWLAFFGPKGLPTEFVDSFDRAMRTVLAQPDLQERLAKIGNEVTPAPASEVEHWVVDATRSWGKVIRDSGFKPQ
jgi:tripartite-type tricarboxylate transporter receptor subunit TctC